MAAQSLRESDEMNLTKGLKLTFVDIDGEEVEEVDVPDEENPFKLAFYKTKDTARIPDNMKVRTKWTKYGKCLYVNLMRKNDKNSRGLTVVRFSIYESYNLLAELENFLRTHDSHPTVGVDSLKPLDIFEGKMDRLTEHLKADWINYWAKPDFELDRISLRWFYKKGTNRYGCFLHNAVNEARRVQHKNWHGPSIALGVEGIRMLVLYLRTIHRRDNGYVYVPEEYSADTTITPIKTPLYKLQF